MATANTLNKMPKPAMTAQITIVAPESVRRLPGGFGSAPPEGGAFGPVAGGIVMPLLLALQRSRDVRAWLEDSNAPIRSRPSSRPDLIRSPCLFHRVVAST